MATATFRLDQRISQRIENVRARWTAAERRRRALAGRRRSHKFLNLVTQTDLGQEIWAVGAPSMIDIGRLAAERQGQSR
jgi:hypothetical protein